jgi:hypothetical protein
MSPLRAEPPVTSTVITGIDSVQVLEQISKRPHVRAGSQKPWQTSSPGHRARRRRQMSSSKPQIDTTGRLTIPISSASGTINESAKNETSNIRSFIVNHSL